MPQGFTFGLPTVQRIFKSVRKSEQQPIDLTAQSKKHYRMNDFVPRFHAKRTTDATQVTIGDGRWMWKGTDGATIDGPSGAVGDPTHRYIHVIYPLNPATTTLGLAAYDTYRLEGDDPVEDRHICVATLTYDVTDTFIVSIEQNVTEDIHMELPVLPTAESVLAWDSTNGLHWREVVAGPLGCV